MCHYVAVRPPCSVNVQCSVQVLGGGGGMLLTVINNKPIPSLTGYLGYVGSNWKLYYPADVLAIKSCSRKKTSLQKEKIKFHDIP